MGSLFDPRRMMGAHVTSPQRPSAATARNRAATGIPRLDRRIRLGHNRLPGTGRRDQSRSIPRRSRRPCGLRLSAIRRAERLHRSLGRHTACPANGFGLGFRFDLRAQATATGNATASDAPCGHCPQGLLLNFDGGLSPSPPAPIPPNGRSSRNRVLTGVTRCSAGAVDYHESLWRAATRSLAWNVRR